MVEALLSVAVIAGVVVGVAAGPAWGVVAFGVIVAAQISLWLERIAKDLRTVRGFVQWFEVAERHRFGKQYPNAQAEWEAARKTEGPALPFSVLTFSRNTLRHRVPFQDQRPSDLDEAVDV